MGFPPLAVQSSNMVQLHRVVFAVCSDASVISSLFQVFKFIISVVAFVFIQYLVLQYAAYLYFLAYSDVIFKQTNFCLVASLW